MFYQKNTAVSWDWREAEEQDLLSARLCSMQDLSPLTRYGTHTAGCRSVVLTTGPPGKDLAVLAWPSFLVCPFFLKNQSTTRKCFFFFLLFSFTEFKSHKTSWENSRGPVVSLIAFSARPCVYSLTGELRSLKPCGIAKRKEKKKKNPQN